MNVNDEAMPTGGSPVGMVPEEVDVAMVGRIGRLPEKLAKNLAELDVAYADGWSVDGSTRLERLVSQGGGALGDPDPALRLVSGQDTARRSHVLWPFWWARGGGAQPARRQRPLLVVGRRP